MRLSLVRRRNFPAAFFSAYPKIKSATGLDAEKCYAGIGVYNSIISKGFS